MILSEKSATFRDQALPDHAAEFVLDMNADDVVKRTLGHKSKFTCARGIEPWGQPSTMRSPSDRARGGCGPQPCRRRSAARRDLFRDRARHARHGEVNARAKLLARSPAAWRGSRPRRVRRMGMEDFFIDRQQCFVAGQRLRMMLEKSRTPPCWACRVVRRWPAAAAEPSRKPRDLQSATACRSLSGCV